MTMMKIRLIIILRIIMIIVFDTGSNRNRINFIFEMIQALFLLNGTQAFKILKLTIMTQSARIIIINCKFYHIKIFNLIPQFHTNFWQIMVVTTGIVINQY